MNNKDNPFFTLAQQIKQPMINANLQQINLGTVISVSPLLINCNGIQLDREDLLISKQLENYTFRVNATFVLLTQDNQRFYLICEVI